MAHKHSVARGTYNHAQHGDPQVRHADGGPGTIPDAQHVAHGFEESVRVLLPPGHVLQGQGGGGVGVEKGWGELLQGEAGWKRRLLFDGSLNLRQTFCQHTLQASELNGLILPFY